MVQPGATLLTLLLEHLDGRNHGAHQLDNDGRTDVRHDTQGKDRRFREGSAREGVIQAEQIIRVTEELRQHGRIHSGDGDVGANAVDDQNTQRKKQLLTQVFDLEGIDERINSFLESFH